MKYSNVGKQQKAGKKGFKVVAFGGGTGLSHLLNGIREFYPNEVTEITAIVAISDNGGSTGVLRKFHNLPAPGDIRRTLVALARHQDLLAKLFEHRFVNESSPLYKHTVGNIILTALTDMYHSFGVAVANAGRLLNIIGNVYPVSEKDLTLSALFDNNEIVKGEVEIYRYGKLQKGKIVKLWLEPEGLSAYQPAIKAIESADLILIGPGSLYTSVLASIIHPEVKQALLQSKATKIYIVNLMTDYGESYNLTASEYVHVLHDIIGKQFLDIAVVNVAQVPKQIQDYYYEKEKAQPVVADVKNIQDLGLNVVTGDFLQITKERSRTDNKIVRRVRHNIKNMMQSILRNL